MTPVGIPSHVVVPVGGTASALGLDSTRTQVLWNTVPTANNAS